MPGREERVDRCGPQGERVHVGEDERAGSLPIGAAAAAGQHLRSHVDADDRRTGARGSPQTRSRRVPSRIRGRRRRGSGGQGARRPRPRTPARRPGSVRPSRRRGREELPSSCEVVVHRASLAHAQATGAAPASARNSPRAPDPGVRLPHVVGDAGEFPNYNEKVAQGLEGLVGRGRGPAGLPRPPAHRRGAGHARRAAHRGARRIAHAVREPARRGAWPALCDHVLGTVCYPVIPRGASGATTASSS